MRNILLSLLVPCLLSHPVLAADEPIDVVIYGGTSAGVSAAIQAARMGKTSIIIEPSKYLGGLTTGGLGATDTGSKAVIGGISREFYQRLRKHYDKPESWNLEKRDSFKGYRKDEDAIWAFEPKVAHKVLHEMLDEHKIKFVLNERLDRTNPTAVVKKGTAIQSIKMQSGKTFTGKMFLDATYEGDLLAAAAVPFHVGREANAKYNETLNGIQKQKNTHGHRFTAKVDPYVIPGDPKSGLLPGIEAGPHPEDGSEDHRLQAYCFRMCMSLIPENRVPFPKPENYNEKDFELLFRNFEAGDLRIPTSILMMPNGKTDTNNNFAVSTDYIGANYKYPEASYKDREKIIADHEQYQKGLMWSICNHPRVPAKVRDEMKKWGLAKDEFIDTNNWPHQIYVREARRMIGEYIMTELDCRKLRATPESIGMGSYNMDSHNCMRYVTPDGKVQNEGDIQVSPGGPYKISYKSITPKKEHATNLLVPVCISCSHMAYGSIRMEPVFFILGQSAATAACLAIDAKIDVQDLPYEKLKTKLLEDKQVLESKDAVPSLPALDPKKMAGVVIDDIQATKKGSWGESATIGGFVGSGYIHDGNEGHGSKSVSFQAKLPADGTYEVRFYFTSNGNRATNVPVTIEHASGSKTVLLDQRKVNKVGFVSLGKFDFKKDAAATVLITNTKTNGHVVADAVQFIPIP